MHYIKVHLSFYYITLHRAKRVTLSSSFKEEDFLCFMPSHNSCITPPVLKPFRSWIAEAFKPAIF